jgi:hypothetical protein
MMKEFDGKEGGLIENEISLKYTARENLIGT